MRVLVVALVMVVAGLAARAPVFEEIPVAQACSCGDCDFVSDSPLVVRGTVTGWEYVRGPDGAPIERVAREDYSRPEWFPRERPVTMTVEVASVFKGVAPERIEVRTSQYDRYLRAEGSPPFGYWAWPAEAGVCFGLGGDFIGQDLLVILKPSGEVPGAYELVSGPQGFDEYFSQYSVGLGLGPPRPPSVGDSPPAPTAESSNDWMFVSAIGGGCLLITLVLLLAGPRREPRDGSRGSSGRAEKLD